MSTILTDNFYKSLMDSIFDAVYVVDVHGKIVYWNGSCARITGYSADEMVGQGYMHTPFTAMLDRESFSEPVHGNNDNAGSECATDKNAFCESPQPQDGPMPSGNHKPSPRGGASHSGIAIVLETGMPGTWKGYICRKNGQRIPIESHISAISDEQGSVVGAVEVFRDISAHVLLEEKHKQLLRMSRRDQLTCMYNRTAVSEILKAEIERSRRYQQPLSIIMVDIDYFKRVNDRYGHDVGDKVLAGIGSVLTHNVRQPDVVGRWGGEEFLIVTPNSDVPSAVQLAERVRQFIKDIPTLEIQEAVSASFGVAQLNNDHGLDKLLYQADMALYQAKKDGRDCVVAASRCKDMPDGYHCAWQDQP